MFKRIFSILFFLGCTLQASLSMASSLEKFIYSAGTSIGYTNYLYSLAPSRIIVPTYRIIGAVTYKRKLYFGASWADTISESFVSLGDVSEQGTRTDFDLTLGYQPNPQWSFYIGYKKGETKRDREFLNFFGQNEPIIFNSSFTHKGPFIGAGYSHYFEDAGKLAFNFAYYHMKANNIRGQLSGQDATLEIDGFNDALFDVTSSTGLSYSLDWSIALTGKTRYFNTLKYNNYRESLADDGTAKNRIVYFNIGLIQYF